ncbi:MAG: HTTM domain-containing protein [Azospirillaceae bacterium]
MLRIAFGALMVIDSLRFIQHDRIWRYYVQPEYFFTYPGFGWVSPLPSPYIQLAWLFVGVFAFLVMIGLFYRFAIVGFTVLFTYFFLLDKAQYLNHFYMVILFAILLCFLPANRSLSVDARRRPRLRADTIPYWPVFALRAQTEIILIYAGLVKITDDWLRGEPLGLWLRNQADDVPLGVLFQYDWVILAGSWGTIALHLIGAPLLLWRRTRMAAFLVYCWFHMSNAYFFNIGIFPWLTIAASTIFFSPDWPRRACRWMLARFETLPADPGPPAARSARPVSGAVLAGLVLWLALQVAVPLRHFAIDSEVRWTGDGHRFAWRMMMYNRTTRGDFEVVDRATGASWRVDPRDYLTDRQAGSMKARPDMILQFARHLETVWAEHGYTDVAVHAAIEKSLNGRDYQPYIDPGTDLTAVSLDLFGPDPWVLPLTVPLETAW